jgi:hypothetical protein
MLFSDHQNSVKSYPKSRKWHFRDSKFKTFLGPLALEALLGMSQLCSATVHLLYCRWWREGAGLLFFRIHVKGVTEFFVMQGVGQDILFSY